MDIEKEIVPRMKSLASLCPAHDTLAMFIRAPNIIATDTSTWLVRRDRLVSLLGIRKDIMSSLVFRQPSILFNSVQKTTGPKIRFLTERVRHKYELQDMLVVHPSLLKIGWGRLARVEFLRSPAVPTAWQSECPYPPPSKHNVLGDNDDFDLMADLYKQQADDALQSDKAQAMSKKQRKSFAQKTETDKQTKLKENALKEKEQELRKEWHLNKVVVTWTTKQMVYHFPKYLSFLQEYTLRAKRDKMWTMKHLERENLAPKDMEEIVGKVLRRKYVKRKLVTMDWDNKEMKKRMTRRVQRMRVKQAQHPPVEKGTIYM